jgi:hypothetical protein
MLLVFVVDPGSEPPAGRPDDGHRVLATVTPRSYGKPCTDVLLTKKTAKNAGRAEV